MKRLLCVFLSLLLFLPAAAFADKQAGSGEESVEMLADQQPDGSSEVSQHRTTKTKQPAPSSSPAPETGGEEGDPDIYTPNGSRNKGIRITGSRYLAKGKTNALSADREVTWKSGNKKIAKVSPDGTVKGVSAGTVRIYATAADGSYNCLKITVYAKAVKKISLSAETTELNLSTKKKVKLQASASPSAAVQKFVWESSDESVATVSSSGVVTARGFGSVTIKARSPDGSNREKSINLTVTRVYRALVIGEERHLTGSYEGRTVEDWSKDICARNTGDMNNMAAMLSKVKGPDGVKYEVKKAKDADYKTIRSLIRTTFADTTEDDVSLFFIATHGDSTHDGALQMPFTGEYGNNADMLRYLKSSTQYLSFSTLASWLNTYVRGSVIVILESCGAGSAIYSSGEEENSLTTENDLDDAAFVSKAVAAFSSADGGVVGNSTGDLRKPKYYVLAASRHMELSWGTEKKKYNYFTRWLIDGVGSRSHSPADADGDRRITLTELFSYIDRRGREKPFSSRGRIYYQHVQRYPVGSRYELFCLD